MSYAVDDKYSMNYTNIYNAIVNNAKNNQPAEYRERHHIIPKCMGGSNSKKNLVTLTSREHFLCHWLLCKIYPDNFKLRAAFAKMLEVTKNNQRIVSSKHFDIVKRNLKGTRYPWLVGNIPWNKGTKGLQVAWNKGIKTGPMSDEERAKRSRTMTEKFLTQEHPRKGVDPWNKGTKGLQVAWNKGIAPPKFACPYCGKVVSQNNLTRWHNDNCKNRLTN